MKEYLMKFPIAATTKRFKKHDYEVQALTDPGYGYLAFDIKNRLHIYVNLHDSKTHRNYNIQISKYYLMEALLHSLMIRPVRKPNNYNFWINKGIFNQLDIMPENFNYQAAVEYNQAAINRLNQWMNLDLSNKEKMVAQQQYNKIKDRLKSIDFVDAGTTSMAITTLSCGL